MTFLLRFWRWILSFFIQLKEDLENGAVYQSEDLNQAKVEWQANNNQVTRTGDLFNLHPGDQIRLLLTRRGSAIAEIEATRMGFLKKGTIISMPIETITSRCRKIAEANDPGLGIAVAVIVEQREEQARLLTQIDREEIKRRFS